MLSVTKRTEVIQMNHLNDTAKRHHLPYNMGEPCVPPIIAAMRQGTDTASKC